MFRNKAHKFVEQLVCPKCNQNKMYVTITNGIHCPKCNFNVYSKDLEKYRKKLKLTGN